MYLPHQFVLVDEVTGSVVKNLRFVATKKISVRKIKKKREKKGVYLTPITRGPRTNPVAVFSAVFPSSQVAVTTMFVFPKPRMNPAFIASTPAGVMVGMIPVDDFPRKTSFPSRAIDQFTLVASPVPVFFTDALTPGEIHVFFLD
jgi:hypothetical protein